jgi:hypothetical protein
MKIVFFPFGREWLSSFDVAKVGAGGKFISGYWKVILLM